LSTSEENTTFFLNLYNFTILFGLCKKPPKKFPKSIAEWDNYAKSLEVKVGRHIFSAFEIQHAILRACMGPPKNFDYDDYPVYMVNDPKILLKSNRAEPLIDFGFYSPYKSSPPLTLFSVEHVTDELRQVAWKCIATKKFEENKKQLLLPGIMKDYEDDFFAKRDKKQFIEFLKSCIPEHLTSKYVDVFDRL